MLLTDITHDLVYQLMLRSRGETESFDSFCAGGAWDISRWWSRFGATTGNARNIPRAPAGAQDVPAGSITTVGPASLQDANVFALRSGGSAHASPPANIRCASGTKNLSIDLIIQVVRNISYQTNGGELFLLVHPPGFVNGMKEELPRVRMGKRHRSICR